MDVEKLVEEVARAIAEAEAKAPEYLAGRVPYEATARSAILATLRGVREGARGLEDVAIDATLPYHDQGHHWWRMNMPKDLFTIGLTAQLDHLIKTVEG